MGYIPSYQKQSAKNISDIDVLLGERIQGTNLTSTYTFATLKEYFGVQQGTYVTSVNGLTGVVLINTGDIPSISNYNYVNDADLETLSRFKVDGENMNLWDADEHIITFVGRDAEHEIGLDMINPLRFDIQVPPTVPTGKATFTLQPEKADALSFIAKDYRLIRVSTVGGDEHIEFGKKVRLGEVIAGDDTMLGIVLDGVSGEMKTLDLGLIGGGVTTIDVVANVSAGAIDVSETVPAGTNLQEFVEQLLLDIFDPTKDNNFVTLNGVSSVTLEVGTLFAATLTAVYNDGAIYSADGSPTIDLTGAAILATFSGNGINPTTGDVSWNLTEGVNQWAVNQTYGAGTGLYYDSDSVESHIFDGDRVASNVNDNSNIITGKYRYWWSVGSIPTTSAGVRALTDDGFYFVSTFDISIPIAETLVAFYLPDTYSSVTVLLVESSNADITSTFTEVAMNVDDANASPVAYSRWESTIPGIGYTEVVTYRIIIT